MDDIRDSVAELKFYRDRVFRSAEETKKSPT
jgi:oligoribonuclease (3'-5' exoribonuclease)